MGSITILGPNQRERFLHSHFCSFLTDFQFNGVVPADFALLPAPVQSCSFLAYVWVIHFSDHLHLLSAWGKECNTPLSGFFGPRTGWLTADAPLISAWGNHTQKEGLAWLWALEGDGLEGAAFLRGPNVVFSQHPQALPAWSLRPLLNSLP